MVWNKFCPNKTLLWKEWKNEQGMVAVFFLFVLFFTSVPFMTAINNYHTMLREGVSHIEWVFDSTNSLLQMQQSVVSVVFLFIVILMAAMMMGRERQQNTDQFLLAMPYSRRELIYHKFLLGLMSIAATFVLNAVIMSLLVAANSDIPISFTIADIWHWTGWQIVILIYCFTFSLFIASLSGTAWGNAVLSLIFLVFPVGFAMLVYLNLNMLFKCNLPEMGENLMVDLPFYLTVPTYFDSNMQQILHLKLLPVAVVLGLVAMLLYHFTVWVYNHNHLERNGEVMMFPQLEGFLKCGVTVCFVLLGGPIFASMFTAGYQTAESAGSPWLFVGYLVVGGFTWWLINRLIKWRKVA